MPTRDAGIDNPSLESLSSEITSGPGCSFFHFEFRMIRISEYPRFEISSGDCARVRTYHWPFRAAPLIRHPAWGRGVTASPAHQMQRDQFQAGHTTPSIRTERQASERHPCCHKESGAVSLLPDLAGRALMLRRQQQPSAFGISSPAPSIWAQLIPPAGRRSCDRSCGASFLCSCQSMRPL